MNALLQSKRFFLALFACNLLPLTPALAQNGPTEAISNRPGLGRIFVLLHDAAGGLLKSPATVRLLSSDGTPIGQLSSGSTAQVSFTGVKVSSYTVVVEAQGYERTQQDVTMPITGEAQVDITLHQEENQQTISTDAAPEIILAPSAKKELDQGMEALGKKDLNAAREHLDIAARLAPSHPDVLYAMGALHVQLGELQKAETEFRQVTQLYPARRSAQSALGIVLSDERKFDLAVPQLRRALEVDSDSWQARWALARCHYHLRSFEEALEQSRLALKGSRGQAPEITMVVAASLTALGQYEESAAMLREFLAQHPDLPEAARAQRWVKYLKENGKIE